MIWIEDDLETNICIKMCNMQMYSKRMTAFVTYNYILRVCVYDLSYIWFFMRCKHTSAVSSNSCAVPSPSPSFVPSHPRNLRPTPSFTVGVFWYLFSQQLESASLKFTVQVVELLLFHIYHSQAAWCTGKRWDCQTSNNAMTPMTPMQNQKMPLHSKDLLL